MNILKSNLYWPVALGILALLASYFGIFDAHDNITVSGLGGLGGLGGLAMYGVGNINLGDINDLLEKQGRSFEEFKKANDQRYKALDNEVREIVKKSNRFNVGGSSYESSYDILESKNQLANYIRSRGEVKMNIGSGPDGGWTVNPVLQDGIGTIVRQNSALRDLVNFIPLESGDSYEELVSVEPAVASWVGETESRPATTAPKLAKITTLLHEVYANPTLTQRLADDSSTSMVDFLIGEVGTSFSEAEETALFDGVGVNGPLGLLAAPTAATSDATRPFGTIQYIKTGASGGLHATLPLNAVKELYFSLRAGYRTNAKWVMNSATALLLSQAQDANRNYLWHNGDIQSGQPMTLMGKEVVICETAPALAADSFSLWFGDWNQAIRGIERPGNKVLLDPFSDKPNLQVYVYRRVGFQLRNSNALKVLKFST